METLTILVVFGLAIGIFFWMKKDGNKSGPRNGTGTGTGSNQVQ